MSAADDIWNDLFGGFESLNRRIEDMFSQMDTPCTRGPTA